MNQQDTSKMTDKEFQMAIREIESLIRRPDIPPLALAMLANAAGDQIAKKLSETSTIESIVVSTKEEAEA